MRTIRYLVLLITTVLTAHDAISADHIGFFSPQGVSAKMVEATNFAMINVENVEQMKQSLELANGHQFIVNLDFGGALAAIKPAQQLRRAYVTADGKTHRKQLAALPDNKIRLLPSNNEIRTHLEPYLKAMKGYKNNIGTIFLLDEPYLNGVSKHELERLGVEVKRLLKSHGLSNVKLGVIFASAMFNPEFATKINKTAGDYALSIDNYYRNGGRGLSHSQKAEWKSWKDKIKFQRLTTYDSAGNMYTGGGLPTGFDVVGFDFYLSTILLDGLHDQTLDWLSSRYPEKCGGFKGTKMRDLRRQLSFFHDGPVLQGEEYRKADRALLDSIFECRMTSTVDLLEKEITKRRKHGAHIQTLLIAESSNNGVLEFDASGNIEKNQPEKLNESRVYDEVSRALKLYRNNPSRYKAGLMFFTYQDEYDNTIKLHVGGAKNMPSVMREISIKQ